MKKTILSAALALGFAAGALAQGSIQFSIANNSSASPTATSNGRLWIDLTAGVHTLLNYDNTTSDPKVYGTLLGGDTQADMAILNRTGGTSLAALLDIGNLDGQYFDHAGKSFVVPNAADGASAFFEVQVWVGNYANYAAAQAAGAYVGQSTVFNQVVKQSPNTPLQLTTMPATILTVPEPGTFALAGLGAAALLIFRRRK